MECVINHMLALLVEWRTNKESSGFMQHILYLCLVKHILFCWCGWTFRSLNLEETYFLNCLLPSGFATLINAWVQQTLPSGRFVNFSMTTSICWVWSWEPDITFHDYHPLEEFFIGRIFSPLSRISGVIHHWRWNQIRLFHQAFGCVKEFNKRWVTILFVYSFSIIDVLKVLCNQKMRG